VAYLCSYNKADHLKLYFLMHYRYVFEFVEFSPPVAFLCETVNFCAAFYWNFVDLFVMVLSMAMASRFRLLNSHLKLERGKVRVGCIHNICDFIVGKIMRKQMFGFPKMLGIPCLDLLPSGEEVCSVEFVFWIAGHDTVLMVFQLGYNKKK